MAFTGGASEAWWRAFSSVPLRPGDRVLAGSAEVVSGAIGLLQARRRGVDVATWSESRMAPASIPWLLGPA